MIVSKNRLRELRKIIETMVAEVPEGNRIQLNTKLLEKLVFFEVTLKGGEQIKIPIWTGPFLRKIDLSELSFENVWFSIYGIDIKELAFHTGVSKEIALANALAAGFKRKNDSLFAPFEKSGKIDFSGTNIKIDFSKVHGTKLVMFCLMGWIYLNLMLKN